MEEDTSSCLTTAKAFLKLTIHPSRANLVELGVHEELNALILKYNEDFEGVLLAYSDLVLQQPHAKILDGLSPYFRVQLSASLLLFTPHVGDLLEGEVHSCGPDYVSLLVLGVFNASVKGKELLDRFASKDELAIHPSYSSRSERKHRMRMGSRVRFRVIGVRVEVDDNLVIDGTLTPSNTGTLDWLTKRRPLDAIAAAAAAPEEVLAIEAPPPLEDPIPGETLRTKKRKKQKRIEKESLSDDEGKPIPQQPGKKTKRKSAVVAEEGPPNEALPLAKAKTSHVATDEPQLKDTSSPVLVEYSLNGERTGPSNGALPVKKTKKKKKEKPSA
eukprot:TRINITY_DN3383_c0_g3_i1.p1 TRINITY_DN3383_c0_g3~~TRINITY_DN3383_c0_g3_i1.p1  ORF type:complete len:330 (+),score=76.27 TRINITY_DN3383_c0_g3_i1:85-1074(+)